MSFRRFGLTARMFLGSVLLLALVTGVLVAVLISTRGLIISEQRARDARNAISAASDLESLIFELQNGVRALLDSSRGKAPSSGPVGSSQPIEAASARYPALAYGLLRSVREDPSQSLRARTLNRKVSSYVNEYIPRAVKTRNSSSERKQAIYIDGRARADLIRALFDQFTDVQQEKVDLEAERLHTDLNRVGAIGIGGLVMIALLIAVFTLYLHKFVVLPVKKVSQAANRLAGGDLAVRVPRSGQAEAADLSKSFNVMAISLESSREELAQRNRDLESHQLELQQALAQLRVLESERARFWKMSPELFAIVDPEGRFKLLSPSWDGRFGYRLADLHSRLVVDFIHPEDRSAFDTVLVRLPEDSSPEGRAESLEVRYRCSDGNYRWLVWTVRRAVEDSSIYVVARDITDIKRRERVEAAENAVSRTISEAGSLEDILHALPGRIALALGWQLGVLWLVDPETQKMGCISLWQTPDLKAEALVSHIAQASYLQGEALPGRVWQTGTAIWLSDRKEAIESARADAALEGGLNTVLSLPITADGTVIGALEMFNLQSLAEDRELIAAMNAVCERIGQFIERKRVEKEADRLKDEFFALVSHELKTPLTSIIGYLELLLKGRMGPVQGEGMEEALQTVDRNAKQLLRLVNDLLFMVQARSRKQEPEGSLIDLGEIVREAVATVKPQAKEKRIELRVDAGPGCSLYGSHLRLLQLLSNLLTNALKFTPSGGVICVTLKREGDSAVLIVSDTGIGIPLEDRPYVFERFYRSSNVDHGATSGIGLGLAITKEIVEAQGGQISVDESPEGGAEFSVWLPLDMVSESLTKSV